MHTKIKILIRGIITGLIKQINTHHNSKEETLILIPQWAQATTEAKIKIIFKHKI